MPDAISYIAPIGTFFLGLSASFWGAYYSRTALLIDTVVDELQRTRDIATPYWCRDGCAEDGVSEAQILGGISILTRFESEMKGSLGVFHERYSELLVEFLDEVSGGEFQTADRKADWGRAIKIERRGAELRMHLKAARSVEVRILKRIWGATTIQRILFATVIVATPLAIYLARN